MQNVRCGSQAVIPRFRMAERTGAGTLLTAGTLLPNHVIIVTYRFRKCNCKISARFSPALAGPLTLIEYFSCLMRSLEFSHHLDQQRHNQHNRRHHERRKHDDIEQFAPRKKLILSHENWPHRSLPGVQDILPVECISPARRPE